MCRQANEAKYKPERESGYVCINVQVYEYMY